MDSIQQASKTNVTHLVWDDDENESLCGLDVSGYEWQSPLFPWNVTLPDDCMKCAEIGIFLEVFSHYNTTYDIKTSLEATVQDRTSGMAEFHERYNIR